MLHFLMSAIWLHLLQSCGSQVYKQYKISYKIMHIFTAHTAHITGCRKNKWIRVHLPCLCLVKLSCNIMFICFIFRIKLYKDVVENISGLGAECRILSANALASMDKPFVQLLLLCDVRGRDHIPCQSYFISCVAACAFLYYRPREHTSGKILCTAFDAGCII